MERLISIIKEMGIPYAYDHFRRRGSTGSALPLLSASGERQLFRRREGLSQNQRGASGTVNGLQRPVC